VKEVDSLMVRVCIGAEQSMWNERERERERKKERERLRGEREGRREGG
jgi:hypothetical protein